MMVMAIVVMIVMVIVVTMVVIVMAAVVVSIMTGAAEMYAVMVTVLGKSALDRTKNEYSYYKGHSEHRSSGKEPFHILSFFWNIKTWKKAG